MGHLGDLLLKASSSSPSFSSSSPNVGGGQHFPAGRFPHWQHQGKKQERSKRGCSPSPHRVQGLWPTAFHGHLSVPFPTSVPNCEVPLLSPDLFLPHPRESEDSVWQPLLILSASWFKASLTWATSWAWRLWVECKCRYYYKELICLLGSCSGHTAQILGFSPHTCFYNNHEKEIFSFIFGFSLKFSTQ